VKVTGNGEKILYVPLRGIAGDLIDDYLKQAGHVEDNAGALFPAAPRQPRGRRQEEGHHAGWHIQPGQGIFGAARLRDRSPCLRATAATNALDHEADIAKVQEWLGHANIATTRIYDHRKTRPEDSPTFKITY
jgi:integrase/recombinase XerD